jgi:hypothetical protein
LFAANKGTDFGLLKSSFWRWDVCIMLAVKAILAKYTKLPTLIFWWDRHWGFRWNCNKNGWNHEGNECQHASFCNNTSTAIAERKMFILKYLNQLLVRIQSELKILTAENVLKLRKCYLEQSYLIRLLITQGFAELEFSIIFVTIKKKAIRSANHIIID